MVKVRKDLIGQRFGRLVVLEQAEDYIPPGLKNGKERHESRWKCICDCGNITFVTGNNLKRGHVTSCGCYKEEFYGKNKPHLLERKLNKYDLAGEYGVGYTEKGEEYWFDLEDYEKIKNYTWYCDGKYFLSHSLTEIGKPVLLHRIIMEPIPDNMIVDHIKHPKNGYISDNRKSNLRIVTVSQNSMNSYVRNNTVSGVKGVNFFKPKNKWEARITKDKKTIRLGYFDELDEAIKIRKEAENKYFGEYNISTYNNI